MKKAFLLFTYLLMSIFLFSQIPNGYYNGTENLSGAELKTKLYTIIHNHTVLSYSDLWSAFSHTDVDKYYENDGSVLDIYSENPYGADPYNFVFNTDQCGNYSGEGSCYNREHSFPKSWFNDASPMYTDLFHIYPTDGYVNSKRSNYPYGEVDSPTWTSQNGSKLGPCSAPGYTGTVFEPIDEFKGDLARTYFYMATCYEDQIASWETNTQYSDAVLDGTSFPCYEKWFLDLLLKWHKQDPVSQKEIDRNDSIYKIQGNRNPFIDHPEFVSRIWESTSADSVSLLSESFSSCPPNGWTIYSIASNEDWTCNSTYGYMSINNYGADAPAEDWLITPAINLGYVTNPVLSFKTWTKFVDNGITHPALTVYYSTDYQPGSNPNDYTWTQLNYTYPAENSQTWTSSGNIDLSAAGGSTIYIGFKYISSGTGNDQCQQWEVDNVNVYGTQTSTTQVPVNDGYIHIYPNPVSGQSLFISTSATGKVKVKIFALDGETQNQLIINKLDAQLIEIPLDLKPGVYIIQVISQNKVYQAKFIKI